MKKIVALTLFGLFVSSSVFAEMGIVRKDVAYFPGKPKAIGYLARPAKAGI